MTQMLGTRSTLLDFPCDSNTGLLDQAGAQSPGVPEFFLDDAYIYLRYCDNWDAGLGLVYNPGERVIVFTSYLYVVLIAAIDKVAIGISPMSVVEIFNILMFAAFCAIMWRFLEPARLLYWATAIFLFFFFPFIDATVNGMETALFLTVIAGTLLALRKSRFEAAILLAAMASITRPEGVLLLLPVCAVALGRLSWRVSGACHGSREATMNGSSMSTTNVLTVAFREAR